MSHVAQLNKAFSHCVMYKFVCLLSTGIKQPAKAPHPANYR